MLKLPLKLREACHMGSHRARRPLFAGLVLALLSVTAASAGAERPVWPDRFTSRLEALALLQTLNANLLSHNSATLTLDRWCAAHHLASDPHVVAKLVRGEKTVPSAADLRLLGVRSAGAVRYRRVKLTCGTHVLSEADNWYVPARLTPAMNKALNTTEISFGRVVHPLHFRRRTLSVALLWHPLPEGWEMGAAVPAPGKGALRLPHDLLQHRAVLTLPDGTPFSLVVETYTANVLAFPPRKP